MPLVVDSQTNISMTKGEAIQVAPAKADRAGIIIQIQGDGLAWAYYGDVDVPSRADGLRVGPYEILTLGNVVDRISNDVDNFQGEITMLWEGGYRVRRGKRPPYPEPSEGNPPRERCACRVVEFIVT